MAWHCPCRIATVALLMQALLGCQSLPSASDHSGTYSRAAVACDHVLASEAGMEMLRVGGNAVDAAVAASFCLSVVRPDSCGIGGGGFMLIHLPATHPQGPADVAVNYRETCPAAVGPDYFHNLNGADASRIGVHAVAVPGTVAGLLLALEQYGTLDHWTVLEPAIRAAEQGWPADAHHVDAARELARKLSELSEPSAGLSEYIWEQLCHSGAVEIGDQLTNPQQARALRLIAEHGRDAFYDGPIGQAIVEVMHEGGGPIAHDDLLSYTVTVARPLRGRFRGMEVLTMPPPSSGGIAILQTLGLIERRGTAAGADFLHVLAESLKHAFADRARWLADSAFITVPVGKLLSEGNLDRMAAMIDMNRTFETAAYGTALPPPNDSGTSHISVVDHSGMAVACTETINLSWGSMVCVPGFGFVLNNEMDDFTTMPGADEPNAFGLVQSDRNAPAPGKRPLSSMSPTIVLSDGDVMLVAGGSGGPRIITATLQCMLNHLMFGMNAQQAVAAPRVHHQWLPDVLEYERGVDRSIRSDLRRRGHAVQRGDTFGNVQMITVPGEGIHAACDPRKGGRPAGQ